MSAHGAETILLTIFLRHDQSKNLDSIQGHLASMGWVGALSATRGRDRQLERGHGDRADRHVAIAAASAQRGECGDRTLRLGRLLDRVLPDL